MPSPQHRPVTRRLLSTVLIAAAVPAHTSASDIFRVHDPIAEAHRSRLEDGRASLERMYEAHGDEALDDLAGVQVELDQTDIWAWQSREPEPPWDTGAGIRRYSLDLRDGRFSIYADRMGAGSYPFHSITLWDGASGQVADLYDGYRRQLDAAAAEDRRRSIRRHVPALLVKAMSEASASPLLIGETEGWGDPRDRLIELAWTLEERPVTLLVDPESYRLAGLVREAGSDVQRIMYRDYEREGEGPPHPRLIEEFYRGTLVNRYRTRRFVATAPDGLESPTDMPWVEFDPPDGIYDWKFTEIADGVHFVGDSVWHSLVVDLGDRLIVFGSVQGAADRVRAITERFPDREMAAVVVSHHHDDHMRGIPAFAEAGATILVAPAHQELARRVAGSDADIRTVDSRLTFTGPSRSVEVALVSAPSHAEEMLVGWTGDAEIFYSADLYVQHPGRPPRAVIPPIRDLARIMEELELQPRLLVDPHSPVPVPYERFRASLARDPGPGRHSTEDD